MMRKRLFAMAMALCMLASVVPGVCFAEEAEKTAAPENTVEITCVEAPAMEEVVEAPVEEPVEETRQVMPQLGAYLSDFKTTYEEVMQQFEAAYADGKTTVEIYYGTTTDMTEDEIHDYGFSLGLETVKTVSGGQDCWCYDNTYIEYGGKNNGMNCIGYQYTRYAYCTSAQSAAARLQESGGEIEICYASDSPLEESLSGVLQDIKIAALAAGDTVRYWKCPKYYPMASRFYKLVFTPVATITNLTAVDPLHPVSETTVQCTAAQELTSDEQSDLSACLEKASVVCAGADTECRWRVGTMAYKDGVYRIPLTFRIYCYTEAALVTQLRKALVAREKSVILDYIAIANQSLTESEIGELLNKAMAHTGTPTEGDYLRWQYGGYHAVVQKQIALGQYHYTIAYFFADISESQWEANPTITFDASACDSAWYTMAKQEAEVDAFVDEFMASEAMQNAVTDYQKVQVIYNWLCDNVHYDFDNLDDDDCKLKHSAYAAAVDIKKNAHATNNLSVDCELHNVHTAVCQGYAVLFYRLALECGIDARVITGRGDVGGGETQDHAWNIVRLGGSYYLLDATWDAGKAHDKYLWFLLGSDSFTGHEAGTAYDYDAMGVSAENYTVTPEDLVTDIENDLNGDGKCSAADMQTLYDYLSAGTLPVKYAADEPGFRAQADCNGDGEVNILDYQKLYQYILPKAKTA